VHRKWILISFLEGFYFSLTPVKIRRLAINLSMAMFRGMLIIPGDISIDNLRT
jgi:hypothetical protein